MEIDALHIGDVYTEHAAPKVPDDGRPPVVFVHGGCHGSWMWRDYLTYAADRGWEAYALNWLGHYGSRELSGEEFVARSIGDVRYEIGVLAGHIGQAPIVVGHSMGGLASLAYASLHDVAALALLAPVVPAAIGGPVIEMPVDSTVPWEPPPFDTTRGLFFQGLDEPTARRYYKLLQAESPKAVLEATRRTLDVDVDAVRVPALVVGAENDLLTPEPQVASLAQRIGARYHLASGRGHSVPYDPDWKDTADLVFSWASAL